MANKRVGWVKLGFSTRLNTARIGDVGGFLQKYFEGKDWTSGTSDIYQAIKGRHVDGRWAGFLDPPVQAKVLQWWDQFQKEFLSREWRCFYTTTNSKNKLGNKEVESNHSPRIYRTMLNRDSPSKASIVDFSTFTTCALGGPLLRSCNSFLTDASSPCASPSTYFFLRISQWLTIEPIKRIWMLSVLQLRSLPFHLSYF